MNWCASRAFSRQELSIQRAFLPFQPFEALLKETQRLYLEFPPSTLEKDVKERYRRYRERMKPPSKPRPPKKVSETSVMLTRHHNLSSHSFFKGPSFNAIGIGVTVLAGVAVVAGIVAYRWLNANSTPGAVPTV